MAAASDFLENELLDHALGTGATFAQPAGIYLKMHLGAPGGAGTTNPAVEVTRSNDITFAAATGGSSASTNAATISNVSTTETITHISLWNAATDGNCLFTGALDGAGVALTATDDFQIPIGDLTITLA